MKMHELKFRNSNHNYSVIIGNNSLSIIQKKIKKLCPKTKKIVLIIDTKVPRKFKNIFKDKLKNYETFFFPFRANEKSKSLKSVEKLLKKMMLKNLNRSDLIISVGGGITGDVSGFVASIYKRGVNFINVPTTLLAQADSAIGGKTGVNSTQGKNLIGSFYQPKLVINDTSFLNSLPKKEMVCGYAEILKHSIIKDKNFFNWLKKNTKHILSKKIKELTYAVKKSCEIKIYYVSRDTNEKGLRMILNFGHTFAHAIEVKNNYSKKISHGEAVLTGMILATRLSFVKNICSKNVLREIEDIYKRNNLIYTFKKYNNHKLINSLVPFLKNDKKNDDDRINFVLLKKVGKTTSPGKFKIPIHDLKVQSKSISQC
tara:strand:- start:3425 stop:4537 length:1113 start_codon:yes stop_codon:yes gene_type:complete